MFERLQELFGGRSRAWVLSLGALGLLGVWMVYILLIMPPYQRKAAPQTVHYQTSKAEEFKLPEEPMPQPNKAPEPTPPKPTPPTPTAPKAPPKPKVETLEQKCRRMARLHSQYSGPYVQAWKVSDCLAEPKAAEAETKPQQVMEIPPAHAPHNEPGMLQPPTSPYQVTRGSTIPVALEGGFDTQVPGQITAVVTRDVMDTRTGKYVMIPYGSKVVGSYDTTLPYDQNRVPSGWNQLILPSEETLDLTEFPAADQAGNAGLPVDIDSRFFKTMGRSFLLTLAGAVGETARYNSYNHGDNYDVSDAFARQGGREMERRSREMWDRSWYRGPTGTAKAGQAFLLQVTKTLTFPGDYYERNGGRGYATAK